MTLEKNSNNFSKKLRENGRKSPFFAYSVFGQVSRIFGRTISAETGRMFGIRSYTRYFGIKESLMKNWCGWSCFLYSYVCCKLKYFKKQSEKSSNLLNYSLIILQFMSISNAWSLQSELSFQTMKLSFSFFVIFLLLNGATAFLYAHPSAYMVSLNFS